MATKIEVEWIAQSQSMTQALERMNAKLDAQDKKLEKIGKTSQQAATAAAGSFAKLEKELHDAEKALKGMAAGTEAFAKQRREVERLRTEINGAKTALSGNVAAQSGATALVSNFTSAIGGTIATIASVGTIAASLKQDLEAISRKRENERMAEVEFGTVMATKTIANLPDVERSAIRPLAISMGEEIGSNPAAVAETLAELRSTGANDLLEAASFLKEAADAFPQDLAAAKGIARAALIEASATGNRNAKQVIGGTIAAQSVSLTSSPEEFAKAFGSNIASGVSVYGQTAEKAREEAAIFSLLETRSSEVAADAQRSMLSQIARFVPETSVKLKAGGKSMLPNATVESFLGADTTGRQAMLENDPALRKQFLDQLQEGGRNAITRRLQPTANDAQIISTAQAGIGSDQDSAATLERLQTTAQTVAAFAISEGRRNAQRTGAELRTDSVEKLTAELEQTFELVQERTRAGYGGTALSTAERVGMRVEELVTGGSRGDVLQNTLQFRANAATDPRERELISAQLERVADLKTQIEILNTTNAEGNDLLRQMLANQRGGGGARQVRPQSAPLPAATIP